MPVSPRGWRRDNGVQGWIVDNKNVMWFLLATFGLLLAPLLPAVLGQSTAVSVVVLMVTAGAAVLCLFLIVRNHRFIRAVKANPELAPSRRESMVGMGALASLCLFFGIAGLALHERDLLATAAGGLVLIGLLTLGVLRVTRSS